MPIEKKFALNELSALTVSGEWSVSVVPDGKRDECVIRMDENLLDKIRIQQKSRSLSIRPESRVRIVPVVKPEIRLTLKRIPAKNVFNGTVDIQVGKTIRNDSRWTLSGNSKLRIADIQASKLAVRSSGSSVLNVNGSVKQASFRLTGDSKCTLSGNFDSLRIWLSGFSSIDVKKCASGRISASGSCNAEIQCTQDLHVTASGSARVLYSGSPKLTVKTSGAASVSGR